MNATFQKDDYLKLLKEFKDFTTERDGPKNGFAWDGPIAPDRWNCISPKIVFLAKETYGFLGCDQCQVMEKPDEWKKTKFNRNIAKIAYGIINFVRTGQKIDRFPPYKAIQNDLREAYASIALLEIKKTSPDGTTKRSDDRIIRCHSTRNKDYLTRQLNLLHPDIIFCCGLVTYHSLIIDMNFFDAKLKPKDYKQGVKLVGNTLVVNYYHPSASQFNIYKIYEETITAIKTTTSLITGQAAQAVAQIEL
jgi:hypothetical protein